MLSDVEQIEVVRHLPLLRQLIYRGGLVLSTTLVLLGCAALAVLLCVLLFALVFGQTLNVENVLVLALPTLVAFCTAMGFSGSQIVPGQPLRVTARKSFRTGLLNGFISGFCFGVLWYFLMGFGAILYEDWAFMFRPVLLIYGALFGLGLMLPFALFKAFGTVIADSLLLAVQRTAQRDTTMQNPQTA